MPSESPLNPTTTHYEFMGPLGTLFMSLGLPCMVVALYVFCGRESCSLTMHPELPCWGDAFHRHALTIVVAWFLLQVALSLLPIGRVARGTKLRNGTRLPYRLNAFHAFVLSHVGFLVAYFYLDLPVAFVYDHYLALAVCTVVLSLVLSAYLYVRSFRPGALLSLGGNSGNLVYDWFMGRELNPRVGPFDWKSFCEMRPGLIGWVLINYCMLMKQYETQGFVTTSMILVCFFQSWYILDALWFEEAVLTTMDIVHDGFGFMLTFGDLTWVPFTYSLQARYLVDHPTSLPPYVTIGIIALNLIGYVVFRGSNSQKDRFRRDPDHPNVRHLKTMPTERGTKLIISGWWGVCRHPNYVGDLIMALSWSLPCGVGHIIPYFYPVYFAGLLIHRQLRDEHQCRLKYRGDWDKYCSIVRWRLIPYIY